MTAAHPSDERHEAWRVGRKVGRTIYNERDELIGVMDTRELAIEVVGAVNAGRAALRAAGRAANRAEGSEEADSI